MLKEVVIAWTPSAPSHGRRPSCRRTRSGSLLSRPDESKLLGFTGPCGKRARGEHFEKVAGDPKKKRIHKKKIRGRWIEASEFSAPHRASLQNVKASCSS